MSTKVSGQLLRSDDSPDRDEANAGSLKRIGGRGNHDATPPNAYKRCRNIGPPRRLNKLARGHYLRGVQLAVDQGQLSKITADLLRMMVWQWSSDTLQDVTPFHRTIGVKNRRSVRWSEYRLREARVAGFIVAQHRCLYSKELWRATSNIWRFVLPAWVENELDAQRSEAKGKDRPTPKAPQNQRGGRPAEPVRPRIPDFDPREAEQRSEEALTGDARREALRRLREAGRGPGPPQA